MAPVTPDTAVILERLEQMDMSIIRLSTILTGDGQPESGISVRMARLEQSVDGCQARHDDSQKTRGKYVFLIFAAIIGAILSAVGYWLRGTLGPTP